MKNKYSIYRFTLSFLLFFFITICSGQIQNHDSFDLIIGDTIYTYNKISTTISVTATSRNGVETNGFFWDLDGDGSYEIKTDKGIINHIFRKVGTQEIYVKITDPFNNDHIRRAIIIIQKGKGVQRTIFKQSFNNLIKP